MLKLYILFICTSYMYNLDLLIVLTSCIYLLYVLVIRCMY